MAKLIYIANTSLDGYVEDGDGGIEWGTPDEEYFASINGLERPIGTYLYGRRMYETMLYWETAPDAGQPAWVLDFTNIWREADKVVFSKTLATVSSARTTLQREFDAEAIRQMKAGTTSDLTVGGAALAAQAFRAGLVDECHCTSGQSHSEAANKPSPPTSGSPFTCSMRRAFSAESSICTIASPIEGSVGLGPRPPSESR